MAHPGITILLACAVLFAGMAVADEQHPKIDLRHTVPIHASVAAGKSASTVCAACHGANGVATVAQFPSLAGQSATYLYVQLRGFKDGWCENAVMKAQVAKLDDEDMRNLAAYYASLPAAEAQTSDADSRGAHLFHDGDSSKGIPPCQGCHGADGRGPHPDLTGTAPQPAWSTFPAVAGPSVDYVTEQLQAYKKGSRKHTTNTAIMHGVVQDLDEADMQAVASYISKL
jgi:cytochrome c553